MASSNHCSYRKTSRRTFLWILLKVYRNQRGGTPSWLLWIVLGRWSVYMAFLDLLSRIVIKIFLASFGARSFDYKERPFVSAQPITPNQTVKRRFSTDVWKLICAVSQIRNLRSGGSIFCGQNIHIIHPFTRQPKPLPSALFTVGTPHLS